jgi:NTE family protein
LSTSAELAEARAETDILIMPRPDGVDIREWKAYEPGIRAGELAAQDALAKIDGPIEALRRPAPKPEIVAPEPEPEALPARTGLARLLPQRRPPDPKPAR